MRKKIAFRIDDVSPYMDFVSFERTMNILFKYGCKPLLGIVPNNKDDNIKYGNNHCDDFWLLMADYEKKGCTLAMHGYEHLYQSVSRNLMTHKKNSEFAGLSYDLQKDKIKRGKSILENNGIYTDIFFAPAHTFDKTTLKCLKENGFNIVSDGRSHGIYCYKGIKHIPVRFYGFPKRIYKCTTIALHPCASGDEGYSTLCAFLEKHKECIVDYKELLQMPCGFLIFQKIDEAIYKFYERFLQKHIRKLKATIKRLIGRKNANK